MPSGGYDFRRIEKRWQDYWEKNETFRVADPGDPEFDESKPKFYVLDMFPYPSGDGLHVGHPEGYTATDIISRYKRMRGFNVLHPMGWDAFGLPAEQYAIQTGGHPRDKTRENIETFRRQIKSLGFSYDWSREIDTTDPNYFRWTQWIFLKLFEMGLAYQAEVPVWWCEELGTVLANEEVIDGYSERGNYPCVRKPLKQWLLKITAYAERLLEDLEELDWPESIKQMQRNWIGKSEGAEVTFEVADGEARGEKLDIFTTRPDTLYGATFMAVAPEHPLVKKLATDDQRAAVEKYCAEAEKKTELERTELAQGKTGVFTGSYAWNPVYEDRSDPLVRVPVYVADYVLMTYGTGAIMAVPGHDERDFDFAMEHDLPIIEVVKPDEETAKAIAAAKSEEEKEKLGLMREAERDGEKLTCFVENGISINSPVIDGLPTPEAKRKITEWLKERGLGEFRVTYRLHDWLFSRQRYWGEPFPVLHLEDGTVKPVPESDLPVELPEMDDFRPKPGYPAPLARAEEWVNTVDPETGKPAKRETSTMPNWAGSCWYYLRFIDPQNDGRPWDSDKEKYWMPVDLYVGGAEHAVLHLLYARFWHKVLYDAGLVSTKEPFQKLYNQGMILGITYRTKEGRIIPADKVEMRGDDAVHAETGETLTAQVEKMSKSRGNVINPDVVVDEYGADTLRLYEMFMGPLDATKPWNMQDVAGVHRFLGRVWRLVIDQAGNSRANLAKDGEGSPELEKALHRCIKKVTEDVEDLAMNTAISAMMIFVNEATKSIESLGRSQAERFIIMLSPFAPHIAEELWSALGHEESLAYEPWPEYVESMLREEEVQVAVAINGKVRARINVSPDLDEEEVKKIALDEHNVQRHIEDKSIRKVIVIPGKMVNIVVG